MATAAGRGPGPCARCARGTIRSGPRTAMSPTAGGRCRRSPAGSMRFSGRRRWRPCRPTRAPRSKPRLRGSDAGAAAPRRAAARAAARRSPKRHAAPAAQDNSAAPADAAPAEPAPRGSRPAPAPPPPAESVAPPAAAPLFRARQDIPKNVPSSIPAVIPIVRAPDDPGIDDDAASDEFAEQINPPAGPGRRLARVSVPLGQLI